MDDDKQSEEFTEALVYIGFNRVTAEAIVAQGFTSPLTLLTVSEDSLSEMARQVARNNPCQGVSFPFVSVKQPPESLSPLDCVTDSMRA
jgi:hypothetical protein